MIHIGVTAFPLKENTYYTKALQFRGNEQSTQTYIETPAKSHQYPLTALKRCFYMFHNPYITRSMYSKNFQIQQFNFQQ